MFGMTVDDLKIKHEGTAMQAGGYAEIKGNVLADFLAGDEEQYQLIYDAFSDETQLAYEQAMEAKNKAKTFIQETLKRFESILQGNEIPTREREIIEYRVNQAKDIFTKAQATTLLNQAADVESINLATDKIAQRYKQAMDNLKVALQAYRNIGR